MEATGYADIIFFAIVAGIILLKFRSVLGRKDHSENVKKVLKGQNKKSLNNVIDITGIAKKIHEPKPEKVDPEPEILDKNIAKTIDDIKKIEPSFKLAIFLSGAKMAFEMVINAFSQGDEKTLKTLLAKDIYEEFAKELENAKKSGKKLETTLVSIISADIENVELTRGKAQIEVKIISEQIFVQKDENGDDSAKKTSSVERITDNWVFEKDIKSSNPNWEIIAT